jgi:hypothetical protein
MPAAIEGACRTSAKSRQSCDRSFGASASRAFAPVQLPAVPGSAPRRLRVSAPVTHQGRSLELVLRAAGSQPRSGELRVEASIDADSGPLIPQLVWAHTLGVTR